MAAPVSEPATGEAEPLFPDLRLDRADLIDADAAFAKIRSLAGDDGAAAVRAATVSVLKQENARARARLAEAVDQAPRAARDAVRAYCALTDSVVLTVFPAAVLGP